jgi:hypothetical protein
VYEYTVHLQTLGIIKEMPTPLESRTHSVYHAIVKTGQIYTDLMGRFPQQSSRGKTYITILYNYDSSNIITAPMKIRSDKVMAAVLKPPRRHGSRWPQTQAPEIG